MKSSTRRPTCAPVDRPSREKRLARPSTLASTLIDARRTSRGEKLGPSTGTGAASSGSSLSYGEEGKAFVATVFSAMFASARPATCARGGYFSVGPAEGDTLEDAAEPEEDLPAFLKGLSTPSTTRMPTAAALTAVTTPTVAARSAVSTCTPRIASYAARRKEPSHVSPTRTAKSIAVRHSRTATTGSVQP